MNENVLARRVVPEKERPFVLGSPIEEVERFGGHLIVERLHFRYSEWPFVPGRPIGSP